MHGEKVKICNISNLCVMSCKFPLATVSDRTCYPDHNLVVVSLLLRAVSDQSRFLEAEGILTEFSRDSPRCNKGRTICYARSRLESCEKRPLTSSRLSVRPRGTPVLPLDAFLKIITGGVLLDLLRKSEFAQKQMKITDTLHADVPL
jgi:hypothetical protein